MWRDAAYFVEDYRTEHRIDDPTHTLGPKPSRPEEVLTWQTATEQLRTYCAALGTLQLADQAIEPEVGLELGLEL